MIILEFMILVNVFLCALVVLNYCLDMGRCRGQGELVVVLIQILEKGVVFSSSRSAVIINWILMHKA